MVTLVGAGPGDSGLITVKGMNKLMEADVVIYDRLIGEEIISMIPETAVKINVGKNAGRHPVPQSEINSLLLSKAKNGLNIVRLKGGDPFVFGRGGEELELLAENGIDFEVVPGVSSSTAGAAYGGIPVTHRDFASSLHIITGHSQKNGCLSIDYDALVKLKGTLVFMMSVSSLGEICKGLLSAGMDCTMPAAVIENATCFIQRKFIGTLETINTLAKENNVISPSVIIIGKVCSLSDKLDWFSSKPLFGKSVMVTRAKGDSFLSDSLRDLGCHVIEAPCIRIVPLIKGNAALDMAVSNIKDYVWLVFTSATGVNLFFDYFSSGDADIRSLSHLKIAAVGSETCKEIRKRGIIADYTPEQYNGRELANGLLRYISKNEKVLLARAKIGTMEIPGIFVENGILCDNIPLYDTVYINPAEGVNEMLANRQIDCVTFTSSSAVKGFVAAFPDIDLKMVNGICIGEKTAETAINYGIRTTIAEKATIAGMVEKTQEVLCKNGN